MAQAEVLQAIANTMTELVETIGSNTEKSLFKIESFRSDSTQNPITWLEEF